MSSPWRAVVGAFTHQVRLDLQEGPSSWWNMHKHFFRFLQPEFWPVSWKWESPKWDLSIGNATYESSLEVSFNLFKKTAWNPARSIWKYSLNLRTVCGLAPLVAKNQYSNNGTTEICVQGRVTCVWFLSECGKKPISRILQKTKQELQPLEKLITGKSNLGFQVWGFRMETYRTVFRACIVGTRFYWFDISRIQLSRLMW